MSVKIKISYNTDQELQHVVKLLSPALKTYKVAKKQEGQYKNAYALLEHETKPERTSEIVRKPE